VCSGVIAYSILFITLIAVTVYYK